MAKPDPSAPVMALLEALANEGEAPIATLRRIIRDRDEQLRLRAEAPTAAVAQAMQQATGTPMPTEAKEGLEMCPKHGRAFRPSRGQSCNECRAEELDARGAEALRINATRSAAEPEKAS